MKFDYIAAEMFSTRIVKYSMDGLLLFGLVIFTETALI